MALFNRLFQSRKVAKSERNIQEDFKPFTFSKGQVRVLLFRECEWRGRKLLFDSSAVEKVSLHQSKPASKCFSNKKNGKDNENEERTTSTDSNIVEMADGFGFKCKMMNPDAILLGEMIFGSVAMNFKGMSLKVHILNAPQRLMCTKVYCSPGRRRYQPNAKSTSSEASISSDTAASMSDVLHKSGKSIENSNLYSSSYCNSIDSAEPSNVSTMNTEDHLSVNWCTGKDDSGFCSEISSHSSFGCNSNSESSSCFWDRENGTNSTEELFKHNNAGDLTQTSVPTSLQWRLNHHLSTALDTTVLPPSSSVTSNTRDSQACSNIRCGTAENLTNSSGKSSYYYKRKEKMGLAIIITLTEQIESQMLRFLMEHAVLVEGALGRLRLAVRDALNKPHAFISNMAIATHEVAQWVVDLLTSPRIGAPLWPFLSCSQKRNVGDKIADIFLKDLCSLLSAMDTKGTYFFMSTLITNILTHHLGWVNSVSPYNMSSLSQQKELDLLNNIHPYNPLWAQLGELYGVIGMPTRISRTIIYGKQNISLVKKILNVLSYFIRCGEVKRLSIESKSVPWDSIDYLMESYQADNTKLGECLKKVESDHALGDLIEMRTFATNEGGAFKHLKRQCDITNNLRISNESGNIISHKKLETCYENKLSPKSNCSLKRTLSRAYKLHNISNTSIESFNSCDSSPNCKSSFIPIDSSELCLNSVKTSDDKCDYPLTNNNNEQINLNVIPPKVNKLCRVPTSGVLFNTTSDIDGETNTYTQHVEMDTDTSMDFIKLECEKQLRACQELSSETSNSISLNLSDTKSVSAPTCIQNEIKIVVESPCEKNVVFVLGEDEVLEGLKRLPAKEQSEIELSCDSKCVEPEITVLPELEAVKESKRSQSYPRENPSSLKAELPDRNSLQRDDVCCTRKPQCQHSKFKKHSGVKFEFDKYPQIVTNYMKSKNLELLDRHVIGKPGNLKMDGFEFEAGSSIAALTEDSDTCVNCSLNGQALQTPSNASELEYTSDIPDQREIQFTQEKAAVCPTVVTHTEQCVESKVFIKQKLEHTVVVNLVRDTTEQTDSKASQIKQSTVDTSRVQIPTDHEDFLELPLPTMALSPEGDETSSAGYCHSLLGGVTDHYISDFVLQGGVGGKRGDWERLLRRDLALQGGASCLLADIDDWSVRVWGGGAGGMSALVASMLDSLPQMCIAKVPPSQCLVYIESKLRELCVRSKALAQLLMDKDFCDMDYLTKTLNLDPNDVPLLLAIASTHTPQVTLKYGVSYR